MRRGRVVDLVEARVACARGLLWEERGRPREGLVERQVAERAGVSLGDVESGCGEVVRAESVPCLVRAGRVEQCRVVERAGLVVGDEGAETCIKRNAPAWFSEADDLGKLFGSTSITLRTAVLRPIGKGRRGEKGDGDHGIKGKFSRHDVVRKRQMDGSNRR